MTTVAVLGAGSWGTTLANLLAKKGQGVRLWAYEREVVISINQDHRNSIFLPQVALAPELIAFEDPREAVRGADVVLSVIPSHAVRSVVSQLTGVVNEGMLIVSATKGIEPRSLELMSEVLAGELPSARVAVLSGPSFAEEVCQDQPTAVVAAAGDLETAGEVQQIFATSRFRVYSNQDVVGVELGGALKKFIAIAAGILEGLGLGNNPRAALVTRGLAEMTRLGVAMGADPLTFAGLAGMGDLILTTTGALSRNRALGIALAQGETLEAYTAAHRTVAEGVNTARAAAQLARKHSVELPITEQVCAVLFEGKPPKQGVTDLMERTLKPELWR